MYALARRNGARVPDGRPPPSISGGQRRRAVVFFPERLADALRPLVLRAPDDDARVVVAADFFAVDFFAVDFFTVDFFAADFRVPLVFGARVPEPADVRPADLFAPGFFAEDVFPVDERLLLFFAADFFAPDFLAEDFFAEDFFVDDFLADDFLANDFFAADFFAPAFRVVRFRPLFAAVSSPSAPPSCAFTVAHARDSASSSGTPRSRYDSSMCSAFRSCASISADVSPLGICFSGQSGWTFGSAGSKRRAAMLSSMSRRCSAVAVMYGNVVWHAHGSGAQRDAKFACKALCLRLDDQLLTPAPELPCGASAARTSRTSCDSSTGLAR